MKEHETLTSLVQMLPRMPGASPDQLAGPVTAAWNAHHIGKRTMAHAQRAVVDTVWGPGYRRGAALGHRTATDFWQNQALDALSRLTNIELKEINTRTADARRILTVAATIAAGVGGTLPRNVDPGPAEADYLTARGDHNDLSPAGRLAAGALVGWTHSLRAGYDDAAASATQDIVDGVVDLVGEGTVLHARIDGIPAPEWLSNTVVAALRQPIPTDTATARPSTEAVDVAINPGRDEVSSAVAGRIIAAAERTATVRPAAQADAERLTPLAAVATERPVTAARAFQTIPAVLPSAGRRAGTPAPAMTAPTAAQKGPRLP